MRGHAAFTYKGKAVKVEQVGQDLGVAFVLEGSVRKAGARVRVTAQLINAIDGDHVWADRFDDLTDIFAIQDEITHAIVDQLKVKLLPQEKMSIRQTPTDNLEAYNYYLKGRELLYRGSKASYKAAREMFAKAVQLDPSYARAYAGIADCDSFLHLRTTESVSPESILATSEKALALDNGLSEAHASRGAALSVAKRYAKAAAEFEKAISLDPNSFEAHYFYARACVFEGKIEQATALFEGAAEVKPDDYQCMCLLVQWYHSLGREQDAKDAARKGAKLAERQLTLHPDDARAAELGSMALIEIGEVDRAREWIARALAIEPNNPPTQYNAACIYALLGDTDKAFDLLERGLPNSGPEWGRWIEHDSTLDILRNHPRYQALLETVRRHESERGV
jgi:adenylate cyclase